MTLTDVWFVYNKWNVILPEFIVFLIYKMAARLSMYVPNKGNCGFYNRGY